MHGSRVAAQAMPYASPLSHPRAGRALSTMSRHHNTRRPTAVTPGSTRLLGQPTHTWGGPSRRVTRAVIARQARGDSACTQPRYPRTPCCPATGAPGERAGSGPAHTHTRGGPGRNSTRTTRESIARQARGDSACTSRDTRTHHTAQPQEHRMNAPAVGQRTRTHVAAQAVGAPGPGSARQARGDTRSAAQPATHPPAVHPDPAEFTATPTARRHRDSDSRVRLLLGQPSWRPRPHHEDHATIATPVATASVAVQATPVR